MDKNSKITSLSRAPSIPSREEAEDAVRTILAWIGEDPGREGLLETPRRFIDAYKEFFKGYNEDGVDVLSKTFSEVGGYDDLVLLKDIQFNSFCEHHMIPFIGKLTLHIYHQIVSLEFQRLLDLLIYTRSVFKHKKQ